MEKIIKHFKALLPCEQMVVTGSYALHKMGLGPEPKDLDIILVNPTEESIGILSRLQEANPAKTKPPVVNTTNVTTPSTKPKVAKPNLIAIYDHEGVKVDFFRTNTKVSSLQLPEYEISTVDHIIAAKKQMSRMKDILQLRALAGKFHKSKDFDSFLDVVDPNDLNHSYE